MLLLQTLLLIFEKNPKNQTRLLHEIPESCWDLLIKWFFEYNSSNFYTNAFFEIIDLIFRCRDDKTAFSVLLKMGLLTKILEAITMSKKVEPTEGIRCFTLTIKKICLSLASALKVAKIYALITMLIL